MLKLSARRLLSVFFFLASALPLLLFGGAFWPTLRRHLDADIATAAHSFLVAAGTRIESSVFERPRSVLPTILMLAQYSSMPLDRLLSSFAVSRPEYAALFLVGDDGRVKAIEGPFGIEDELAPGSPYVLRSRPAPGDVAFSAPFLFGSALVVEASYATPRLTAVGLISLDVVSSRLVLSTRSPGDRAGVVDGGGFFVACSDPSRILDRTPLDLPPTGKGLTRVRDQGRWFYSSVAPIGNSTWNAVYLSSVEEADEPLRAFVTRLAIVAAASLGVAAAIAVGIRRSLSEPLAHLVSSIGMIASGRYGQRVQANALAELDDIGRAFNAMADSIQRRDGEIQRSEERYRLLFLANRVPALLVQVEGLTLRDANDSAAAFYGYSRDELRGMLLAELGEGGAAGPALARLGAELERASRMAEGLATRHRLRSGALRDVELHVGPIAVDDSPHYLVVAFDVTRRRVAEERMASALDEKTLLLKEVYHRVKNNLQIISSLLNMQAGAAGDGEVAIALRDGQDRVYAMALVHELVYQMDDLSSIDVAEYASRLSQHVADAYSTPRELLAFDLRPLRLELERAIPFGLALNEMLSNAFKYAGSSRVTVALRIDQSEGEARARLSVEDEGPGLREGALDEVGSSIGISVIRGLAEQLHGAVDWSSGAGGRGVSVRLGFPVGQPPFGERGGGRV